MHSASELGRILLVDDLALFRRMLPLRLGALGRSVEAVASVAEARASIARHPPELVLLDVVMPGVDGFTYCRELKADPATRALPVIMLTDLKANGHDRSLEAGADDYLPKRASDAVLRIRIQLHLHLGELRRRAREPYAPSPASILVATANPTLHIQFSAQFALDSHRARRVETPADIVPSVHPEDRLLVLDMDLGTDALHEVLAELRMEPATAEIPILLLCAPEQLDELTAIEFMVDDVMWKPLKAPVNRHRLKFLLELGAYVLGSAPVPT